MGVGSTESGMEHFVRLHQERHSRNGQDPYDGRPHVPHGNREPCRRRGGHPRLGRGSAPLGALPGQRAPASGRRADEAWSPVRRDATPGAGAGWCARATRVAAPSDFRRTARRRVGVTIVGPRPCGVGTARERCEELAAQRQSADQRAQSSVARYPHRPASPFWRGGAAEGDGTVRFVLAASS